MHSLGAILVLLGFLLMSFANGMYSGSGCGSNKPVPPAINPIKPAQTVILPGGKVVPAKGAGNQHTGGAAGDTAGGAAGETIVGTISDVNCVNNEEFIRRLNKKLVNLNLQVTVTDYVTDYNNGWVVSLIDGDNNVVANIKCFRYPKPDGSMWVGINSFTSESHRKRGLNLFLRAVVNNVLHNIFKGLDMYVYSSIANKVSLYILQTYFVIDYRVSDIKNDVVLCRSSANIDCSNIIIRRFLEKFAE